MKFSEFVFGEEFNEDSWVGIPIGLFVLATLFLRAIWHVEGGVWCIEDSGDEFWKFLNDIDFKVEPFLFNSELLIH
jgi:hypothetical protein